MSRTFSTVAAAAMVLMMLYTGPVTSADKLPGANLNLSPEVEQSLQQQSKPKLPDASPGKKKAVEDTKKKADEIKKPARKDKTSEPPVLAVPKPGSSTDAPQVSAPKLTIPEAGLPDHQVGGARGSGSVLESEAVDKATQSAVDELLEQHLVDESQVTTGNGIRLPDQAAVRGADEARVLQQMEQLGAVGQGALGERERDLMTKFDPSVAPGSAGSAADAAGLGGHPGSKASEFTGDVWYRLMEHQGVRARRMGVRVQVTDQSGGRPVNTAAGRADNGDYVWLEEVTDSQGLPGGFYMRITGRTDGGTGFTTTTRTTPQGQLLSAVTRFEDGTRITTYVSPVTRNGRPALEYWTRYYEDPNNPNVMTSQSRWVIEDAMHGGGEDEDDSRNNAGSSTAKADHPGSSTSNSNTRQHEDAHGRADTSSSDTDAHETAHADIDADTGANDNTGGSDNTDTDNSNEDNTNDTASQPAPGEETMPDWARRTIGTTARRERKDDRRGPYMDPDDPSSNVQDYNRRQHESVLAIPEQVTQPSPDGGTEGGGGGSASSGGASDFMQPATDATGGTGASVDNGDPDVPGMEESTGGGLVRPEGDRVE